MAEMSLMICLANGSDRTLASLYNSRKRLYFGSSNGELWSSREDGLYEDERTQPIEPAGLDEFDGDELSSDESLTLKLFIARTLIGYCLTSEQPSWPSSLIFDGCTFSTLTNSWNNLSHLSLNRYGSSPQHHSFWKFSTSLVSKFFSMILRWWFISSTTRLITTNGSGIRGGQANCGGASLPCLNNGFNFFLTLSIRSLAAFESSRRSLRTCRKSSGNSFSAMNDLAKSCADATTLLSEEV
ncbi:hypothetical protein OGATHE_003814 [Ogataea polymorpha]|uniref:Uncharacterized protein n=1 Tax=Ogataea polymorpha TaxID=460523 RepID=A0A9P8T485_9ASCO|nr:hypothetical protein OGATHE_003814 [Ogataea polymorpha]